MGTQESDAAEANETSYPPSYEETQYEPSNSDTAPLLDRKLAHVNTATSGAQPRHVTIDVGGSQASTSTGNSSSNAVNYLYIDSRSDVVGDYVIDTDLAPIPGRFKSLKDKDAAENVYISLSHGALLNVKLYISGTTPAKVTVAVPRSHSAVLPHCLELIPVSKGETHPPLIRLIVNRVFREAESHPPHENRVAPECEDIVLLLPLSQSYSTAIIGPIKTSEAIKTRLRCVMRNDDRPADTKHVLGELPPPPEEPTPPVATTSSEPAAFSFWTFLQQQLTQPAEVETIVCNSILIDPHFQQDPCLLITAQEWYGEGVIESTRAAREEMQAKSRRQNRIAALIGGPLAIFVGVLLGLSWSDRKTA